MGGKKKYINIFGSFTEPFNYNTNAWNAGFIQEKCVYMKLTLKSVW